MDVRKAGPSDLPSLVALEEECFSNERFSLSTLRAFISRADAFALVAEESGRFVGAALCICSAARAEGRIASVAVVGGMRRRGVGALILQEAEAEFGRMGARVFGLEVDVGNRPAISLYLKRGYSLRGVVRDYYGPGRHALVMEKVLPPSGRKVTVRLS